MLYNKDTKNKGTALGPQYNPNNTNAPLENMDRPEFAETRQHMDQVDDMNIFSEIY